MRDQPAERYASPDHHQQCVSHPSALWSAALPASTLVSPTKSYSIQTAAVFYFVIIELRRNLNWKKFSKFQFSTASDVLVNSGEMVQN